MTENPVSWQDADSLAEAIFTARESLDGLAKSDQPDSPPKVSFQEIYRYATDSSARASTDLIRVLTTDARAREDLRCLLARVAPYQQISRAAASSGAVTTRSGSGFEMSLRESRADRDQLYLIIKLASTAAPAPGTLFVIGDGDGCRKVPLPRPINGVYRSTK